MDSSYMWYAGRRKIFLREPYPGQSLRRKMFLAKSDNGTKKGACADVNSIAISYYSLAKESLLSCAEPCNSWKNRGKESRDYPRPPPVPPHTPAQRTLVTVAGFVRPSIL